MQTPNHLKETLLNNFNELGEKLIGATCRHINSDPNDFSPITIQTVDFYVGSAPLINSGLIMGGGGYGLEELILINGDPNANSQF